MNTTQAKSEKIVFVWLCAVQFWVVFVVAVEISRATWDLTPINIFQGKHLENGFHFIVIMLYLIRLNSFFLGFFFHNILVGMLSFV